MCDPLKLRAGSRVAVVGGGPAGTLTAYFLLEMGRQAGIPPRVELFEPRDYGQAGPSGCNMCGGVLSESLVQILATEGIRIPPEVIRETIDSYTLHTREGAVRIPTARQENRIAAIFRGGGPRGTEGAGIVGFDAHLLQLARAKGVQHRPARVTGITLEGGRPHLTWRDTKGKTESGGYDLLVGAVGVNGPGLRLFESLGFGYAAGRTARAFVTELQYPRHWIRRSLGCSMHIFLLNLPGLEFAAAIPKGDQVTFIILGQGIDKALVERVLDSPQVRAVLPPMAATPLKPCLCQPHINVGEAKNPWTDRVVMVGDSAVSRLYKDGIGAAYQTAKACARTALFHGIGRGDFATHYAPTVRRLARDNRIGWRIFTLVGMAKRWPPFRQAMLETTRREQLAPDHRPRRLSAILWDIFTGSASYGTILRRATHPALLARLAWFSLQGLTSLDKELRQGGGRYAWSVLARSDGRSILSKPALGTAFADGQWIFREGERGECLYVILEGLVEILIRDREGHRVRVAVLERDNIFGTGAIFQVAPRPYGARALGEVRVMAVDHQGLMRRLHQDPALAVRIIVKLSERIRSLQESFAQLTPPPGPDPVEEPRTPVPFQPPPPSPPDS